MGKKVLKKSNKTIENNNITNLKEEISWLNYCISKRIDITQGDDTSSEDIGDLLPPQLTSENSSYGEFVNKHNLNSEERLVLILSLAVQLRPNILDVFAESAELLRQARICKSESGTTLLPTADTALFILAGDNMEKRIAAHAIFEVDHLFYRDSVIETGTAKKGESKYNGILSISPSSRDLFIHNKYSKPRFSEDFPAHILTTNLEWEDMVLMPRTRDKLAEVKAYMEHYNTLVNDWGMSKHARPGCKILFYGDSGTGKTLSASLMGKYLGKDVYRVDISAVTSKYVGETSKRLDSLFNTAESKGWIIFIDEGDALLGQRKQAGGSDNVSQYANQDVAYLLQRIETFDGIIIVATNLRSNIDSAFTRRFQSMVRFEMPDKEGQLQLWTENLPKKCPLSPRINMEQLVKDHPLAPASIINVIYRVSVLALKNGAKQISDSDLQMCVKDEEFKYKGRQQIGM